MSKAEKPRAPRLWMLAVAVAAGFVSPLRGQGLPAAPPPRPRVLFRAQDIPTIQARATASSSRAAWAFTQLATTGSFQCGTSSGTCPGGSQSSWRVYRSVRGMLELAVRYAVAGDLAAGQTARTILLGGSYNALNSLVPTGAAPYVNATYPAVIGATYDLIRPLLSAAERALVVQNLEQWIAVIETSTNPVGSIQSYGGATDNFAFSWATGLVMALLSIWGDSGRPNIPADVARWANFIADGYRDVVSPDGSIDESYGYANYGELAALWALLAAEFCGFGDRISTTNIMRTPAWIAASLLGDSFPWFGDSSPSHRGMRVDPILYAVLARTQDPGGLYGMERVQAYAPLDQDQSTWAFSPYLAALLYYPDGLVASPPAIASAFFRDNLNLGVGGDGNWNKLNNHPLPGLGGTAFLHNAGSTSDFQFGLGYVIRDEWMNHAHEDDGHVVLSAGGRKFMIDRGYASNPGSVGAQSDEHNLVTVASAAGFGGANHFQPPGAEGRFYGRRLASLFSRPFDVVRGDHRVMWMMQKAERTIILVKDPLAPFAVVVDEVERGGTGSATYEQRWTMATPVAGAGTVASPLTATSGSTTLRATYLSPAQVSVVPGSAATLSSSAITYYPNKVVASGAGPQSFFSVLHASTGITISPLDAPAVGTLGARIDRGTRRDRVLVATTAPGILDARTMSDGEVVWTAEVAGVITGYALSEGTELVHDGIPLVESAEKLSAAIGMGEIVVSRAVEVAPGAPLPLARFLVPPGSTITRVTVDGTPVAFAELAGRILIGTRVAAALGGDRFYSFTAGNPGDAVLGGGAFLTTDDRLSAGAGGGRLDLRGGAATPNLALAVAYDLEVPAVPAGTPIATLEFRGGTSGGIVGTITALSSSSGVVLQSGGGALPANSVVVPRVGTEAEVRVFLRYHPRTGKVIVRDRSGRGVGGLALPPTTESVATALVLMPASYLDDIAYYDAAEDGLTPQGIVVWLGNDGRFGWALSSPSVLSTSGLVLSVNQVPVSVPLLVAWAQAANFLSLIGPAGGATPTSWLHEVAFESAVPAVPALPGYLFAVNGVSIAGTPLQGQAAFGP